VTDTPEEKNFSRVPDTAQAPPPIVIFPARLSNRMMAEANKMFREAFSTPRAEKRKPSQGQERRARTKERKESATP